MDSSCHHFSHVYAMCLKKFGNNSELNVVLTFLVFFLFFHKSHLFRTVHVTYRIQVHAKVDYIKLDSLITFFLLLGNKNTTSKYYTFLITAFRSGVGMWVTFNFILITQEVISLPFKYIKFK